MSGVDVPPDAADDVRAEPDPVRRLAMVVRRAGYVRSKNAVCVRVRRAYVVGLRASSVLGGGGRWCTFHTTFSMRT